MEKLLHQPALKLLAQALRTNIQQLFNIPFEESELYHQIVRAPDLSLGHFAFPCFPLAKMLKQAPPVIAQKLAEAGQFSPEIQSAKATGPYLNFILTEKFYGERILAPIISGDFLKAPLLKNPPATMIEYSQPNTHKELHVGHMRNLCLGNALIRLYRYTGHKVYAVTYPGDVGTHVAKCLWYMKKHITSGPPTEKKGAWLGELYSKANNLLEDEVGTPTEVANRQELTLILKQLEARQGEYFDLWLETREWSIQLMKDVYRWAEVEFDHWFWESEFDSSSLKLAHEYYKKGLYIESEGAIGMDLSQDGLGFCMIIKSDGTGLYATKDIALAQKKFKDYPIEKSIYIVDKRQAHHFKQVFKVLEKLDFPHAKDCYHLQYDFVELPSGAMSSRKGNIVPIMALIDQMQEKIKTDFLNKYLTEWTAEEIAQTATIIANGAIKYGMIRMDNSRKIVFEISEWLKLDGETGPYLQYVCARINSLFLKFPAEKLDQSDWSLLKNPREFALMVHLSMFNTIAVDATLLHKTPVLCGYLYDLGKLFNNFYAECSIGRLDDLKLKQARMALTYAVGTVMKQGLALLGIEAPARM
ncbi:MAG: arginine--tRNA ligase [Bdellovibrionales bacterium GWA2_49_15]|nr:MAG: arginine--tRNA ligase [Bdellovibrionales bacterium GWA2_49_15]HAZ12426.1 arginine--tRNA ligase [Bdellovibrionales bacterium]